MTLNVATTLRESAAVHPDKTAIAVGELNVSYSMLHGFVQQFAGALGDLGVGRGDNVALMLPNVPHFTVAYYGVHYAGGAVVPMNVLLAPDEIAYHLEDSDAAALIVWEGFYEAAKEGFDRVAECRHLIIAKADLGDTDDLGDALNMMRLIGSATPVTDLPATMPDDPAVILYTSGTTGKPKGAQLSHFNMFFNAYYCRTRLMPMDESVVALATLPLFHSFGQTVVQNAVLGAGGTVVLLPRFEPTAAMELIEQHRVNLFAGVPTMYFALLNSPDAENHDLSSLEYCVSGGSAMPVEVMKAFDAKYGVNILEGYGLTETSPVASCNVLDRPKKAGSVGLPIWGVEFRLEDKDGNVVEADDTPGEICIKGHNVMLGYYNRPEVNETTIVDGWFHTGDIGTRDSDGYYFIVDRTKDMIIRGGFNVYPREIEEVLFAHPAVAEAAVIGVPHESHGEEIKAIVTLKPDASATEDEIIAFCKEHLAAYKYPRIVAFSPELPKGPTGKILKRELS